MFGSRSHHRVDSQSQGSRKFAIHWCRTIDAFDHAFIMDSISSASIGMFAIKSN